ncbi:MAG: hypothetical protein ACTSPR_01695 [Candidatus Thorarchaeota archaeon]
MAEHAESVLYEGQKVIHADKASDFFLMLDAYPNVSLGRGESDGHPVDPSGNEERASQGP